MNTTTNYSLPQWEDTDRVTREDINGAMSAIDGAIAGKCRIVTGSYVGDDTNDRGITLGSKPKAVFFSGYGAFNTSGGFFTAEHGLGLASAPSAAVTDTGFIIKSSTLNRGSTTYIYLAFM